MTSLDENLLTAKRLSFSRVQMLIIGRLLSIFLLLVTSWVWLSGTLRLSQENFPEGLSIVFVVSVGLTIVYFFLLRISTARLWQVKIQLVLDAFLITWLIVRTGDLASPYITLYIVLIGVTSLFLRPKATLAMAIFCVLLFMTLAIISVSGLVPTITSGVSASRAIQIVSFHVVAFLVVGLLASRLSERQTSGAELREAEKVLANLRLLHERIVESIRSGLITTDLDGKIYTFNRSATEMSGLAAEKVIGTSVFGLFGEIQESIRLSLASALDGQQPPRFETNVITPEGYAVRVGYSVAQLFSESGEASGLIFTFQDLTEVRAMEDSIRRKDRLAAVGRVAAGLAHEIRNPLGAMRGAIQVLESATPKDSSQAKLMDIILKESDRLNLIITNFLSYARPAATHFADTDVAEAIRETVVLLHHSPDIREGHKIIQELGNSPVIIAADSAQLKQIFWNLSRNAIQAMPDGGTLRFGIESIPNNRIRITFEDTGSGMSAEQVEKLFEPFSESTSGGTGLGLSIVYQIVRDHNGVINVRSIEGKGTTIIIELPRENRMPTTERTKTIDDTEAPTRLNEFIRVNQDKKM